MDIKDYSIVSERIVVKDYLDDIAIIVPDPKIFRPPKGVRAISNVIYQQIYIRQE
jgi:hypothetical protein